MYLTPLVSRDATPLTLVRKALAKIDVVIFVPLSSPDEITIQIQRPQLRSRVDRWFKTMLRDDGLGLLHDGPRKWRS
jgi:hypothetical protein